MGCHVWFIAQKIYRMHRLLFNFFFFFFFLLQLFYYNLVSKSQVVVSTSLCPRCTTTLHCLLPQKPALNHISLLLSKLVARIRFSLEKQLKFEFIPSIHKPLEANVKGPMLLTRHQSPSRTGHVGFIYSEYEISYIYIYIYIFIYIDVPLESVDGSQDEQQSRRPARGKYGDRRGTGLGPA
jgi:hypothetical protein